MKYVCWGLFKPRQTIEHEKLGGEGGILFVLEPTIRMINVYAGRMKAKPNRNQYLKRDFLRHSEFYQEFRETETVK
jgi:hypothetical protein